jgi:hypothetical protein
MAINNEQKERISSLKYNYSVQPKARVNLCNLCGSTRFIGISHYDRYGYPANACGCIHCGLVFLNPMMTSEAYGLFYRDIYRSLVSAYHGRTINAMTIQDEQISYAEERIELLNPFLSHEKKLKILDIGGSTGVIAHKFAQSFNADATVLDPAPLEIAQAQQLGLKTITGFVEEYTPGAGETYNLVLLCQTIDHLLDVSGTLSKIRTLIAQDGLLFVDIVDVRAAYLRNWSIEEAIKIDHPYYLTQQTASAYLSRAGFEIIHIDYASDHLHVGFICRPAAQKIGYLPDMNWVERHFQEIRYVQNAYRMK